MTGPQKRKAPEALARPEAQKSKIDSAIIAASANAIKARLMAGEIVGALDYPESERAQFWSEIAMVLDDLPCVRQTWRTIAEHHVDGVRTRQKMFRIFPRQKGVIDATLAGLLALAATCVVLLAGGAL